MDRGEYLFVVSNSNIERSARSIVSSQQEFQGLQNTLCNRSRTLITVSCYSPRLLRAILFAKEQKDAREMWCIHSTEAGFILFTTVL